MKAGKRIFDIIFSAVGLAALSPVMLAVAVAVKIEDGGPVLFLQERVGRGFRKFGMIKFRSMVVDAESKGLAITMGGDPRVTRVGRYLRKTKLDELPQLLNVLKGDMSLVGPRPEVPKYVEAFRAEFEKTLIVRPGITDYASIMFRDEEDVLAAADDPEGLYVTEVLPRKLRLNMEYIKNMCISEDIRIIFKTFRSL